MDRSPSDRFRIVVVDGEPCIRHGLQIRLDTEPDLRVVGTAATGSEALELVRERRPDLVLIDVPLPATGGFAAIAALGSASPSVPVVVLTLYDDAETRQRANAAGATALVSKHDGDTALLRAIRHHLTEGTVPPAPTPP